MACFLAPAVEAIVVTIIKERVRKREVTKIELKSNTSLSNRRFKTGISWSRRLNWLTNLLWGGVFLLGIEHIWHGEVIPWPPFLTAMISPDNIAPMMHEIATVGVSMALFVTVIWGIMVLAAGYIYKRTSALKHVTQED